MTNDIFPWQKKTWQRLQASFEQNRLPHALLFSGIEGLGKKHCARLFAEFILCSRARSLGKRCEQCHACHLIQAQTHPDLVLIEPEEESRAIKIDQIRNAVSFVNETSLQQGFRAIIIHPANAMNVNAANALLKTLEEPPENTLFILVSDEGDRLPATILSRCQKIFFTKPTREEAVLWLQAAGKNITEKELNLLLKMTNNAPLKSLQLLEQDIFSIRKNLYDNLFSLSDPLALANEWQEKNIFLLFQLMQYWLRDLLRIQTVNSAIEIVNDDYHSVLMQLSQKISATHLQKFLDYLQACYLRIMNGINLNRQLLLEELFIAWRQYVSS